jgi:hypothetical protein
MADYDKGPDEIVTYDKVISDGIVVDWLEEIDVQFPARRIFQKLSGFTISQTYSSAPIGGDELARIVPIGGSGPFTVIKDVGDGDDNNADVTISGDKILYATTLYNGSYTARFNITDDTGVNEDQIITWTVIDAPAPVACGTSNSNPTLYVKIESANAGGATRFPFSFLGCSYTDGETKEVYSTSYDSPNANRWTNITGSQRIQVSDISSGGSYYIATTRVDVLPFSDPNPTWFSAYEDNDPGTPAESGPQNLFNVVSYTVNIGSYVQDQVIGSDQLGEIVFDYAGSGDHIKVTLSLGNGW